MTVRASNNIPPSLRRLWQYQELYGRGSTNDSEVRAAFMAGNTSLSPAKAIVCHDTHANGGWRMEDVGVRKPGDGELLVEMVASGVCHTVRSDI